MYAWILKINNILIFFWRIVWLNILWLLSSLLGLIWFGVGPATMALMITLKKLLYGRDEIKVTRFFFHEFKKNYKEGLLISLFYLIAGHILVVDLLFSNNTYIKTIMFIISFVYIISLTFIIPLIIQFEIKNFFKKVRMSFLVGLGSLHYTLVLYVILVLINIFMWKLIPAAYFLVGISINAIIIIWFSQQIFSRVTELKLTD
jgi:uncharacterized membrane protein YesL